MTQVMPRSRRWSLQRLKSAALTPFNIIAGVLSLAVAVLVFAPIAVSVVRVLWVDGVFQGHLFEQTFSRTGILDAARNTIIIAVAVNIIALPSGAAFAWFSFRTDARMGLLVTLLPIIPLLIPNVAMIIGWVFLASPDAGFLTHALRRFLGLFGVGLERLPFNIFSWPGLILLYVLNVVPVAYVISAAAYRNVDPLLEEAARLNGSSIWRTFITVSFPAIRPALLLSSLLITMMCFGMYSVPAVIASPARIPVLSVYAVRLINGQTPPAIGEAAVIGLCLLLIIGSLWVAQQRLNVFGRHATIGGMGMRPNVVRLGAFRWVARTLMLTYAFATSILPMVALMIVSVQPFWTANIDVTRFNLSNFVRLFATPFSRNAIYNSLLLAFMGSVLLLAVAALLMIHAEMVKGKWRTVVGLLTKVPAALSTLVIAIGMYVTLGGAPFYLNSTIWILLASYIVLNMPQASIATEAAVKQIGGQLAEASRMCGAGGGRTFLKISLPLMLPGLAAGWALVFTDMIGELTASVILAGPRNPVIGYVIIEIYEGGTYAQLAALATLITVISTATVAVAMAVSRPRYGRSARNSKVNKAEKAGADDEL